MLQVSNKLATYLTFLRRSLGLEEQNKALEFQETMENEEKERKFEEEEGEGVGRREGWEEGEKG